MKKVFKNTLLWITALLITIFISYYQKTTGPTWPVKFEFSYENKIIKGKLLRSYYTDSPLPVEIEAADSSITASVKYKRFRLDEPYTEIEFKRTGNTLKCSIPPQPPAGKIEYIISIFRNSEPVNVNFNKPVVARFKGRVSAIVLVFHILFMFAGVLLAIKTLLNCFIKDIDYKKIQISTFISIFIGGMIFGPLVQKSAFGDYWTGFPFGTDLTDNKVLISLIIWGLGIVFRKNRSVVIASALFMLFIYFIPHSVLGSDLDYKTGKMKNKFSFLIKSDIKNTEIS